MEEEEVHSLELFSSLETEQSTVVFYTGGPVWGVEWAPVTDAAAEQYIAIASYRDLDKVPTCRSLSLLLSVCVCMCVCACMCVCVRACTCV